MKYTEFNELVRRGESSCVDFKIECHAQRVLTSYIYKACCLYERIHGGSTGANHVFTQVFQLNPLVFLRDNKVFVFGSAHLDPAQAPRNVLACKFEYNPYRDWHWR